MRLGLSRSLTVPVLWALDNLVPAWLRDQRWFMGWTFRLFFGQSGEEFLTFKSRAPHLSEAQLAAVYRRTAHVHMDRDTDLNRACLDRIVQDVVGPRVLDAGCGRLFLSRQLAEMAGIGQVIALDFVQDRALDVPVQRIEGSVAGLPLADRSVDTVVCSHTLEHLPDLARSVAELRRVAARRLIIVVPRQRPFRYSYDLHLHFFPYRHSLLLALGQDAGCRSRHIEVLGGDLYYCEDRTGPESGSG